MKFFFLAVFLVLFFDVVGLSKPWPSTAPPMGYNTLREMGPEPSSVEIVSVATKLKATGLLDVGYNYFVIDDGWMSNERDWNGNLQEDKKSFPNGLDAAVKDLHGLGFKVGLTTSRGPNTCHNRLGSYDHEEADARQFAALGIDMVKNDACWDPECGIHQPAYPKSGICPPAGRQSAVGRYNKMWKALNESGRVVLHAAGGAQPWYASVGDLVGQTWRVAEKITDFGSVYQAARIMEQLGEYHGNLGFADLGSVVGSMQTKEGRAQLTPVQARAQYTLWTIFTVPLFLEISLKQLTHFDYETFSNQLSIAIHQDTHGGQPKLVFSNCPKYPAMIFKKLQDGTPQFRVRNADTFTEVVCGAHKAPDCASCPRGNGPAWCNGECRWVEVSQKCVPSEDKAKLVNKTPIEERPEPWTIKRFLDEDQRKCQLVWGRRLGSGRVALAAINFDKHDAPLQLRLSQLAASLDLASANLEMAVEDVWYDSALVNPHVISDVLNLKLQPNGGHAFLRLSPIANKSRGTAVPTAAAEVPNANARGSSLGSATVEQASWRQAFRRRIAAIRSEDLGTIEGYSREMLLDLEEVPTDSADKNWVVVAASLGLLAVVALCMKLFNLSMGSAVPAPTVDHIVGAAARSGWRRSTARKTR